MYRFSTRVAALAAAAALLPFAAHAFPTTPESSTLSTASPTAEFTGGDNPAGGILPNVSPTAGAAGVDEPICAFNAADCDIHPITFAADVPNGSDVTLEVLWTNEAGDEVAAQSDYDIYVYKVVAGDDGEEFSLAGTAATSANPERMVFPYDAEALRYDVEIIPFAALKSTYTGTLAIVGDGNADDGDDTPSFDPCVATGEANEGGAFIDPMLRKALYAIDANAVYGAFVHFTQGTRAEQNAILADHGLTLGYDFRDHGNFVFANGLTSALRSLASEPSVSYLEYNAPMRYFGDTQSWATRARVAHEPAGIGPFLDAASQVVDGNGVTLGVIDSGVFGTHPDFSENLKLNYKLTAPVNAEGFPQYVEVGLLDSESTVGGHGTHVTGTVAGRGTASDGGYPNPETAPYVPGTYSGAAPGADLIHWGNGAALFVLDVTIAYAHMLDNLRAEEPLEPFKNLRAVNNSYGSDPGPYNPASAASCLIKEIVAEGVVMAFAAGNDGDGNAAGETRTSPSCKDPTPGVICVASYDDQASGTRNGPLSGFSSRGLIDLGPADYPDIAAPGSNITSTCINGSPSQAICSTGGETDWAPWYGTISGTSMATPHIVGIIGLMTQVDPSLTPAEIETIMQENARRIGDGYEDDTQAPFGQIHHGYGYGLVDVPAILADLGASPAGLPENTAFVVFEGDLDDGSADDVVSMTMQESTEGGRLGVSAVLTLADAELNAGTTYRITGSAGGTLFSTAVTATESGVSIPEAGPTNTAVADSASIDGTELTVFVPYQALGLPAAGEPVHNLRVVVSNGSEVDYAPSNASGSAQTDELQPMFGRAWTVLTQAEFVPDDNEETACELPGITVATDDVGDSTTGQDFHDVEFLAVAEPFVEGAEDALHITMKVGDLTVPPQNSVYYVLFDVAGDNLRRYVSFTSDPAFGGYEYGHEEVDATTGQGSFVDDGDTTGTTSPDGFITFVLPKSFVPSIADGGDLSNFSAEARLLVGAAATGGLVTVVDDAGGTKAYEQRGSASCDPASNTAPVAALTGPASAEVDESVVFDASASTDVDGDSLTFSFDFGDGTEATVASAVATASHAFAQAGDYTVTVTVTDGSESATATHDITVGEDGGADAPEGDLTSSLFIVDGDGNNVTSIDIELEEGESVDLMFDASASGYSNDYEPEGGFDYIYDFGNQPERVNSDSATISQTYASAGSFTATVQVIDNENGELSGTSSVQINVTMSVTVQDPATQTVAKLIINNSEGPAPLRVEFDGSGSFPGSGRTIVSYVFDYGDGNGRTTTDAKTSWVYTTPGTYTPTLEVIDSEGGSAKAQITVKVEETASGGDSDGDNDGGVVSTPPGGDASTGGGSSGSLGSLLLLPLMGLALVRRRRAIKVARAA